MSHDRREPKRARQACLNCRRKKARCSGEKPVCAFCARLNQPCEWDSSPSFDPLTKQPSLRRASSHHPSETALAARVALLEAKLALLNDEPAPSFASSPSTRPSRFLVRQTSNKRGLCDDIEPDAATVTTSEFSTLPNHDIQRHLIDVYFEHNHNQPYSYFHETTFRRRFDDGCVPEYLMLAFIATACRFSDHDFVRDRRMEAMTEDANASWRQIYDESFSSDANLDFPMVQATSMLAAIEFTSGKTRLGWVKASLTIRFAQGLRLNEEPEESLPVYEQEERRRTFWSVYLVRLPCHEDLFRNGLISDVEPTLEAVIEEPTAPGHQDLDYFAMTVLMASAMGRFIRGSYAMWDPRSPYYDVHSILLHFESLSPCSLSTITETLQYQFTFDGQVDKQRAGHFLYSHALYHLTHCLLNHPFVFHHILQQISAQVPPGFVAEGLARCHRHATELLGMLQDAQQYGRLVQSSFYGYCAMLCGGIHRLYETHDDSAISSASRERARAALDFLEAKPVLWPIFNHMAHVLRYFKPDIETAKALTSAISLSQKVAIKDGHNLWQLLDYALIPETNPLTPNSIDTTPGSLYGPAAPTSTNNRSDNPSGPESQYSQGTSGYFPDLMPDTSEGIWSRSFGH
ncbi:hypothetical protein PRZ48_003446 [Zasmidium cellare]|uniref:Zn(2)-C6 fungal-type domain-containing protein n=1 Tax=Zasmidium cellare TaxID=395010 RepID=A0ABR0EWM7_ZASCE|nr:hypothetical protein PRZ48_003446 [Zasmidium cellare]